MRIAIIIPAYEPNMVLLRLLEELNALYDSKKFSVKYIVVDDGSLGETSKKTFAKIDHLRRVVILKHQKNQGKGAALKTGIKYAHQLNVDLIITADADGQHTADDIKSVGDYACKHQNFTIGSRDFKGDIPVRSQIGNFITSRLFKLVFKLNITDTQSGLRAFPSRLFDELLSIKQNRYEYEFQSLIEISKKEQIDAVPIQTIYEPGNPTSHFRPLVDSSLIYIVFLRYSFFVPLIATLDIIAFLVLEQLMTPLTAFAIARSTSVMVYFIAMRYIIFKIKKNFIPQLFKFLILVITNIALVNGVILSTLAPYEVTPVVVYIVGVIPLFLFNFAAQRYVIFKK